MIVCVLYFQALGEIKLTSLMQYHQPSPDSFIINTCQRYYGIRLTNNRDATLFHMILNEIHQSLAQQGILLSLIQPFLL